MLDRKLLVNLGLLSIALATAVVLFLTRDRPTEQSLQARAQNLLPSFRSDRVRRVRIETQGRAVTLVAEPKRDAGAPRYRLEPSGLDADPEAVRSFLVLLEQSSALKRLDASAKDATAMGFEPPRARLVIELDGLRGELTIGKPALTPKDTSYVEVTGFGQAAALALVRTSALDPLLVSEDALRPAWLVPYGPSELVRLSVRVGKGPEVVLEKRSGPAFRRENGERVARQATDGLLLELSRARTERGLADSPALFPEDQTLSAQFQAFDSRPKIGLELGAACGDGLIALRRSGQSPGTFCVKGEVRAMFLGLLERLRDDSVFALRSDEVERLVLDRAGKQMTLRRTARGFELKARDSRELELQAGNRLLEALTSLRGELVPRPDLPALGLSPAAGSVRLESAVIERNPEYAEVVAIGKKQGDGRLPLRRESDGAVLLVPASAENLLSADASLFRPLHVLDFGPSELVTLELSWDGERELLKRNEAGVFELVEPAGFAHDAGLVLDLVQRLGTLEADRWVEAREAPDFGLEHPLVKVEARLSKSGKASRFVLRVGAETAGGHYAALDTLEGVFVVPKGFVEDLRTLLIARDAFVMDPSEIERIELTLGKRRIALERHGDAFRPLPGTPDLAPPAVERLVARVTSLRAEAALHTGPTRPLEQLARPALEIELVKSKPRPETVRFAIGAEASFRGSTVRFARRSGVNATFAIAQGSVREILEAF